MIKGITPLRPTRKMQTEAKANHSKILLMEMTTTQVMMIPMMKIERITGTNGGRKVKKKSHTLAARTVLSRAPTKMQRTSKGN